MNFVKEVANSEFGKRTEKNSEEGAKEERKKTFVKSPQK